MKGVKYENAPARPKLAKVQIPHHEVRTRRLYRQLVEHYRVGTNHQGTCHRSKLAMAVARSESPIRRLRGNDSERRDTDLYAQSNKENETKAKPKSNETCVSEIIPVVRVGGSNFYQKLL